MKDDLLDSMPPEFLTFCWMNLPASARAAFFRQSSPTVWVFGAGASHHYNLNQFGVPVPLATGFFNAFNRLPTSQGFGAHVGPLISFLEHYKGVSPDKVPTWNENIEDFMTSIESELARLRKIRQRRTLRPREISDAHSYGTAFNNMNFIFANVLNEAQNGAPTTLYHSLLQMCGPNDAFITFNWDTLLDRALADSGGWSPNDGYGVNFAGVLDGTWRRSVGGRRQFESRWRLLKLHGSTNWLVPYLGIQFQTLRYQSIVPRSERVFMYWHSAIGYDTHKGRWRGGYVPTCYGYYPPNIPGRYFDTPEISAGPGRIFLNITPRLFSPFDEPAPPGVPSSPLLITPVRQKKYEMYASTIASLWKQAERALNGATRIVIIGYSFPTTDVRTRELLVKAVKKNGKNIELEIVAPNVGDIVNRMGPKLVSRVKSFTPHDMKFEDFLQKEFGQIPQRIKEAAASNEDLRNWMNLIYRLSKTTAEQRQDLRQRTE